MFENFGKEICTVFKDAEQEMLDLSHPYVGSEHLLLSLLKNDVYCKQVFAENDIFYEDFKRELVAIIGQATKKSEYILYTPLLRRIIDGAVTKATRENNGRVTGKHLLISLVDESDGIAIRILKTMGLDMIKLRDSLELKVGISSLEEYGNLLTRSAGNDILIGRDKEINELINILLKKNKANPLLVGKAGVGKTALVEELARRIENGDVPDKLLKYKVYALSLGSLISGTKYRGDFEERLTGILKELENNDIILFIDEIHGITTCGSAEGAVCAAEILKPYLTKGNIRIIGATTEREFNQHILRDKALMRRFELVRVVEPSDEDTLNILKGLKEEYETYHEVVVSDSILSNIVRLSSKYLRNKSNPDRAIELLDTVCATAQCNMKINDVKAKLMREKKMALLDDDYEGAKKITKKLNSLVQKKKVISSDDILKVLKQYLNVNIFKNKQELMTKLDKNLNNLIGQKQVKEKVKKLVNYKLSMNNGILSILLLGNTGVGKTELVKLVAESIDSKAFLRLDMSEYNLETSINKLIGVSSGYVGYGDECEFEKIKLNPFSVILVDEVEKAHPKVLNLFLQILDEGFVTDSMGEKIDFNNTIIFFTSNLGGRKSVGFSSITQSDVEEFFTPELLGRIDEVLRFEDIKECDVLEYVDKYNLINNKGINKKEVLKRCNYQKYGLRNVRNVIRSLEIEELVGN